MTEERRTPASVPARDEAPGELAPLADGRLELLDRLLGRFAQADASDTRKLGGAGLGLYIARRLIEHHGGQLGFDEERERGAAFYFDLPLGFG